MATTSEIICTHCKLPTGQSVTITCAIRLQHTHANKDCLPGPLTSSATQISKYLTALNKNNDIYQSSVYHICEYCWSRARNHGGIIPTILADQDIIREERNRYIELSRARNAENEAVKNIQSP